MTTVSPSTGAASKRVVERHRLAADESSEIVDDVLRWQPRADAPPLELEIARIFTAPGGDAAG